MSRKAAFMTVEAQLVAKAYQQLKDKLQGEFAKDIQRVLAVGSN